MHGLWSLPLRTHTGWSYDNDNDDDNDDDNKQPLYGFNWLHMLQSLPISLLSPRSHQTPFIDAKMVDKYMILRTPPAWMRRSAHARAVEGGPSRGICAVTPAYMLPLCAT